METDRYSRTALDASATAITLPSVRAVSQQTITSYQRARRERLSPRRCPKNISISTLIQVLLFGLVGILSLGLPGNGDAAKLFEVDAKALADVQMPIPEVKAAKDYLGLSGTGTFTPSQIRADTVVIEVFNMYCPVCQKEAPAVNELHRLIETDKDVQGKVKIIGIGIGNTPFEVDVFRNNFHVPFPLFPDDDSQMRKASAQPFRTPTFIVARVQSGRTFKIMKVHVGRMEGPAEFLTVIKSLRSER